MSRWVDVVRRERHRYCEQTGFDVVEQTLVAGGSKHELDETGWKRVRDHTERAMAYVGTLDDAEVEYTYDELYGTAEFDDGDVSDPVDHLVGHLPYVGLQDERLRRRRSRPPTPTTTGHRWKRTRPRFTRTSPTRW